MFTTASPDMRKRSTRGNKMNFGSTKTMRPSKKLLIALDKNVDSLEKLPIIFYATQPETALPRNMISLTCGNSLLCLFWDMSEAVLCIKINDLHWHKVKL